MTGVELIAKERKEQIEKHGRTIEYDKKYNVSDQLRIAAMTLMFKGPIKRVCPTGWDKKVWKKMSEKSYEERLIIAGAFLAAELDRLEYKKSESLIGMHHETPEIKIGDVSIRQMSSTDPSAGIWIDIKGEGGQFRGKEFEEALTDLFHQFF